MSQRGRGEPQELRDCGVRTSWVREWSPWGVNVAWPMVPSGLAELETAHRGAMDEVNRLKRKLPSPSDLKPVKIWPSSKSRLLMIEIDISLNNKTESKSCTESEKPCQRVSNADRKVFTNPESFYESGKFLQQAHCWLRNFQIFWKCTNTIQNIQIICKVSGWTGKFPDDLKSVRMN